MGYIRGIVLRIVIFFLGVAVSLLFLDGLFIVSLVRLVGVLLLSVIDGLEGVGVGEAGVGLHVVVEVLASGEVLEVVLLLFGGGYFDGGGVDFLDVEVLVVAVAVPGDVGGVLLDEGELCVEEVGAGDGAVDVVVDVLAFFGGVLGVELGVRHEECVLELLVEGDGVVGGVLELVDEVELEPLEVHDGLVLELALPGEGLLVLRVEVLEVGDLGLPVVVEVELGLRLLHQHHVVLQLLLLQVLHPLLLHAHQVPALLPPHALQLLLLLLQVLLAPLLVLPRLHLLRPRVALLQLLQLNK